MKVICSYCRRKMDDIAPFDVSKITHSMCPNCNQQLDIELKDSTLSEFIDQYEMPVLVVNEDARVLAANIRATQTLNRESEIVNGYFTGEVLECEHSSTSEGCGRTAHCLGCSLRNTINEVMQSGNPKLHVGAVLSQDQKNIDMVISAEKLQNHVKVTIEQISHDMIVNG